MAKTATKYPGIVKLGTTTFQIRVQVTCPRTGKKKEVERRRECTLNEAHALQQAWREVLDAVAKSDIEVCGAPLALDQ